MPMFQPVGHNSSLKHCCASNVPVFNENRKIRLPVRQIGPNLYAGGIQRDTIVQKTTPQQVNLQEETKEDKVMECKTQAYKVPNTSAPIAVFQPTRSWLGEK